MPSAMRPPFARAPLSPPSLPSSSAPEPVKTDENEDEDAPDEVPFQRTKENI